LALDALVIGGEAIRDQTPLWTKGSGGPDRNFDLGDPKLWKDTQLQGPSCTREQTIKVEAPVNTGETSMLLDPGRFNSILRGVMKLTG
jgi:hypothetical protein